MNTLKLITKQIIFWIRDTDPWYLSSRCIIFSYRILRTINDGRLVDPDIESTNYVERQESKDNRSMTNTQ